MAQMRDRNDCLQRRLLVVSETTLIYIFDTPVATQIGIHTGLLAGTVMMRIAMSTNEFTMEQIFAGGK